MYRPKGRWLERLCREKTEERVAEMNAILDAAVQFIQMGLLLIVVVQNFGLRARLKAMEEKLGR